MSVENLIFSQLLLNDEYTRRVIPHLKEEYFATEASKIFLKIYNRFFTKYDKIPSKQTMLLEIEKLKGSADLYNSMVEFVNATEEFEESIDYLVEQTEEYCKERALYNAIRDAVLIMDGSNPKETRTPDFIPTLLSEALAVCFDTTVGHDYVADAEERYDFYHNVEARVPTGNPYVDKITRGGFPRKTLNVVIAPPHGGKTITKVNLAAGALMLGYNVLYITMEMAQEMIAQRFDARRLNVNIDDIPAIPKDVFTKKIRKLADAGEGKLVIKEYPTGMASAANFKQLVQELKTKQGFVPDLIVVDYLNICASQFYKAGTVHNSYTVVGSVGKELRAFAKESDAAVLTSTQTNRDGVNASEIDMTSVSDSSGTSMIADFMMATISTGDLKALNQLLWQQIKNRYSNVGDDTRCVVGVDYNKMTIYPLESDAPLPEIGKPKSKTKVNKPETPAIDMGHTIKPEVSNFDDFNFEE